VSGKVVVKDHGAKALFKAVNAAPKGVRVGVFGTNAAIAVKGKELLSMGQLATWLEHGTERMPARFWLSGYMRQNESRIKEMLRRGAEEVAKGRMTQERVLNLIGLKVVGEIKERIANGLPPPNAASTIKRKGSSTPLIDTEQFRSNIAHGVDS
jgi:hypothetical protein